MKVLNHSEPTLDRLENAQMTHSLYQNTCPPAQGKTESVIYSQFKKYCAFIRTPSSVLNCHVSVNGGQEFNFPSFIVKSSSTFMVFHQHTKPKCKVNKAYVRQVNKKSS